MRIAVVLALCLALLPASALAATPGSCGAPAAMGDGWPVAAPAAEGLNPKLICAIGPTLEKLRAAEPRGVVVVRHGKLVYEHYFVGGIAYGPDTSDGVHSITKSVVALLFGIAFDRGWLKSLDTPIFSFFPKDADLRTPEKNRITLRDLLTMTSGLDWPEHAVPYGNPANFEERLDSAPDPYHFVLERPVAATPGTVWNYNSGVVELLGAILQRVSHQPLTEFAKTALFDPLGIKDWQWLRSPNGTVGAAYGLYLRPRDLAKIGQLVLNHGAWDGHRIVSARWITEMTARQIPRDWTIGGWACSYGYLWWRDQFGIDNRDVGWVGGIGLGGQRLFVVPSLDLVVAVAAGVFTRDGPQDVAGYTALALTLRAVLDH